MFRYEVTWSCSNWDWYHYDKRMPLFTIVILALISSPLLTGGVLYLIPSLSADYTNMPPVTRTYLWRVPWDWYLLTWSVGAWCRRLVQGLWTRSECILLYILKFDGCSVSLISITESARSTACSWSHLAWSSGGEQVGAGRAPAGARFIFLFWHFKQ